jgi:hypothetical protein
LTFPVWALSAQAVALTLKNYRSSLPPIDQSIVVIAIDSAVKTTAAVKEAGTRFRLIN